MIAIRKPGGSFRQWAALAGALFLGLLAPSPAGAAGNLLVGAVLTGTVSPALDTTPRSTSQTIDEIILQYAGTIGSKPVEGIGFCTGFAASGAPETVVSGFGSGSMSCTTMDDLNGWGSAACTFLYQRAGAAYAMQTMSCAFSGLAPGTVVGTCAFAWEPASVPAATFLLEGSCLLR